MTGVDSIVRLRRRPGRTRLNVLCHRLFPMFLLFYCALSSSTATADSKKSTVAVQRLLVQRVESVGVDTKFARSLEEAIVLEVGKRSDVSVVTAAEMEQTINFAKTKADLGCNEIEKCMVEVKKKLDVDKLVVSTLSKLGSDYLLSIGLVDLARSAVKRRVARQGKSFSALKGGVSDAVDELLAKSERQPAFRLAPGTQLKLAVMPLKARGVSATTADAMTQILSAELNQIEGISVISRDDITAILSKVETESMIGCTDNLECIVEIGAALGLSKLVTGTVGKVEETFVVSMQLVDTRQALVENRVLESFDSDPDELKNAVKLSAYELVGVNYSNRRGRVKFTFNVKNARAYLGEHAHALVNSQLGVKRLEPGRYSLRVIADPDDYYPLQTDVFVAPDTANIRTFTIQEKPTPWYTEWWVWTVAGAVVAGSTIATIVLLTNNNPNTGSGEVIVQ